MDQNEIATEKREHYTNYEINPNKVLHKIKQQQQSMNIIVSEKINIKGKYENR